jgi:hypothetical protein
MVTSVEGQLLFYRKDVTMGATDQRERRKERGDRRERGEREAVPKGGGCLWSIGVDSLVDLGLRSRFFSAVASICSSTGV